MKKLTKWGLSGIAVATLLGGLGSAVLYATNPWDTLKAGNAGCSMTYCSSCGGYNRLAKTNCSQKERYCTYVCPGEQGQHEQCMQDDGC